MSFPNFINAALQYGLSKKFNFVVDSLDPLPDGVQFPGGPGSDTRLYINSLKVPSRRINTTTVPYKAFDFILPTNAAYPENQSWSITVMQDKQLLFREMFERWSQAIYSEQSQSQSFVPSTIMQFSLYEEYPNPNTNFQDKAGTDRKANFSNMIKQSIRQYTLYGVFPVNVDGVQYNYSDGGNSFASFNVSLAYQYFTAARVRKFSPGFTGTIPHVNGPSVTPLNGATVFQIPTR